MFGGMDRLALVAAKTTAAISLVFTGNIGPTIDLRATEERRRGKLSRDRQLCGLVYEYGKTRSTGGARYSVKGLPRLSHGARRTLWASSEQILKPLL